MGWRGYPHTASQLPVVNGAVPMQRVVHSSRSSRMCGGVGGCICVCIANVSIMVQAGSGVGSVCVGGGGAQTS